MTYDIKKRFEPHRAPCPEPNLVLRSTGMLNSAQLVPPRAARNFAFIVAATAFGMGCTNQVDAYESEAGQSSTHAVLKIQHVESLNGSSRGDAIAGFIKIPAGADA